MTEDEPSYQNRARKDRTSAMAFLLGNSIELASNKDLNTMQLEYQRFVNNTSGTKNWTNFDPDTADQLIFLKGMFQPCYIKVRSQSDTMTTTAELPVKHELTNSPSYLYRLCLGWTSNH